MAELTAEAQQRINRWLEDDIVPDFRSQVESWQQMADKDQLVDAFHQDLSFGTAGLRGVVGAGSNRMNRYTVGRVTQALAQVLRQERGDSAMRIIVGHDTRVSSREFALLTAEVLSGNGFAVELSTGPVPTPIVSFAVRSRFASAGIVITASHNPPEYNGYKVFASNGGQIVSPFDTKVQDVMQSLDMVRDVTWNGNPELIFEWSDDIIDEFMDQCLTVAGRSPGGMDDEPLPPQFDTTPMVYTSLHGTGYPFLVATLEEAGFEGIEADPSAKSYDGMFSSLHGVNPNPEDEKALANARNHADRVGAGIVLATDPDADRLAADIKDADGVWRHLTGNQIGLLIMDHLCQQSARPGDVVVSSIVSSPLVEPLAEQHHVASKRVLTGFKNIAEAMDALPQNQRFLFGFEESYGYLALDHVRDKDSISTAVIVADILRQCREQGETPVDRLLDIYRRVGVAVDQTWNFAFPGADGAAQMGRIMHAVRESPPELSVGAVSGTWDLKSGQMTGHVPYEPLPQADVVIFMMGEQGRLAFRPSGTEPKLKVYASWIGREVPVNLSGFGAYEASLATLKSEIAAWIDSVG